MATWSNTRPRLPLRACSSSTPRTARRGRATEVANGLGIAVALVEQPYRVAGRRSTPAAHLLLLWTEVVKQPRREGAVVPHQESARETTVYGKRESR
jgi:hypothetical protein